ncbi:MAG: beta-N-acetylhexosaminidase [Elusimicrobia bacterium]|nr:beta-N-acetylhexosaminidase [Elusimicrobiota bacterium]MDE2236391.1 beta-N-acetylhexosaminidase [Elusimicrobiota bacterium]MDE2426572.1 beta-N-acetylhexosaminidase [Elusimicrobiota bacterium]
MRSAGFPFLFGIHGRRATRETVGLLRRSGACGVLLLARNIETAAQTKALTEELTQRLGRPLLFSVDHEGGWVLRFRQGVTALPGNCALGRAADDKLAYATGRQMALELRPLGIQLNLAPVLDVLTPNYNPGIGIRSFGPDPALAGRLGSAMIRGLQDHGVSACAKHFPGKGAATVDAHVALPTIRLGRSAFERGHLRPFKDAVRSGVACVMTSHVRYPALDGQVATFSEKITRRLLRERLGFKGVVIADDLCMGAVSARMPIQEAAVKAFAAGHDLLILAHDRQAQEEAAQLMEQALADGLVDREGLEASCARIAALLERPASPQRASAREGQLLARRVARRGIALARRGALALPLKPSKRPLLVVLPDFSEVAQRFTFEGGPRGPEREIRGRLSRWGRARLLRAPVESGDLNGLAKAVEEAERVLFFCFEARRFPGQKAALRLLSRRAADKTAVALVRGRWDLDWADPKMTALDAGGYRLCQLSAVLDEVLA